VSHRLGCSALTATGTRTTVKSKIDETRTATDRRQPLVICASARRPLLLVSQRRLGTLYLNQARSVAVCTGQGYLDRRLACLQLVLAVVVGLKQAEMARASHQYHVAGGRAETSIGIDERPCLRFMAFTRSSAASRNVRAIDHRSGGNAAKRDRHDHAGCIK